MPRLKDSKTKRLTFPSDPEAWCDMKDRPSSGDLWAAQSALLKMTNLPPGAADKLSVRRREQAVIDPGTGVGALTEYEMEAYFTTLISHLVVAWNWEDEDGQPLPISPETVKRLDAEDGKFLQVEAQQRIGGRPQDQQDPSRKPSSASSPVGADGLTIAKLHVS